MLTIKVIEEDGHELVKSGVKAVAFNPPIFETGKQESLFVWYKDESPETFLSGKVYVMNENGKTVADYQLPTFPVAKASDTEIVFDVVVG